MSSSLYNYADDNTLSFCNPDFDALISTLETDSNQLIEIDPWGTPLWMSAQLLSTLLTLICCFLFDK
jgi:hypothetical protein